MGAPRDSPATVDSVWKLAMVRARAFRVYDREQAEDLAQEAWVAAWMEIEKGNTSWAYLRAVIDNRIKTCLKFGTSLGSERHTRVTRPPEGSVLLASDSSYLFETTREDDYPSDLNWVALRTDRDRIFLVGVMAGESPSAIARQMGLSEAYGRSEWARIKKYLVAAWLESERDAA